MLTTITHFHSPFVEHVSAVIQELTSIFSKESASDASQQTISSAFVPRRPPISIEVAREIERLELAVRQGSINAYR